MIHLTKFAYMTFDQCIKENNELQKKLNVEVDEEESKRVAVCICYFLIQVYKSNVRI